MTNAMPCGCEIISDNLGAYEIEYCPKHKAADDMYEALKAICEAARQGEIDRARWIAKGIGLQALAKAGERC